MGAVIPTAMIAVPNTAICESCGKTYTVGEWPWCPHGFGNNLEEPLEPYVDDNLTADPGGVEITTRSQRRQLMKEKGFEYRKKASAPGRTLFFDMKRK